MKVAGPKDPALVALAREASKLSWEGVTEMLASVPDEQMIQLLDVGNVKVGDTASYFLGQRGMHQRIIEALMADEIKSAPGRVRAVNTLSLLGASLPQSIPALVKLLDDRSEGVMTTALGSLVFFRHRPALPAIEARLATARPGSVREEFLSKAKAALEADDPFLYPPTRNREQATRLWKLDEDPYWKRACEGTVCEGHGSP